MLNVKPWGLHTTLANPLSAVDTTMRVAFGTGAAFTVPATDHFYATIRSGAMREVVRVDRTTGDEFLITRGLDNTSAKAFPAAACVDVEWNPMQLCEFVQSGCIPAGDPVVAPGVYCGCDTCFEVNAEGRIIGINGSTGCP